MMQMHSLSVVNLLSYTTKYYAHHTYTMICWIMPNYSYLPDGRSNSVLDNLYNYLLGLYRR